ncbi:MAG: hypothetical protein AB1405_07765, partial [Bdellovibrionota bacterium]
MSRLAARTNAYLDENGNVRPGRTLSPVEKLEFQANRGNLTLHLMSNHPQRVPGSSNDYARGSLTAPPDAKPPSEARQLRDRYQYQLSPDGSSFTTVSPQVPLEDQEAISRKAPQILALLRRERDLEQQSQNRTPLKTPMAREEFDRRQEIESFIARNGISLGSDGKSIISLNRVGEEMSREDALALRRDYENIENILRERRERERQLWEQQQRERRGLYGDTNPIARAAIGVGRNMNQLYGGATETAMKGVGFLWGMPEEQRNALARDIRNKLFGSDFVEQEYREAQKAGPAASIGNIAGGAVLSPFSYAPGFQLGPGLAGKIVGSTLSGAMTGGAEDFLRSGGDLGDAAQGAAIGGAAGLVGPILSHKNKMAIEPGDRPIQFKLDDMQEPLTPENFG